MLFDSQWMKLELKLLKYCVYAKDLFQQLSKDGSSCRMNKKNFIQFNIQPKWFRGGSYCLSLKWFYLSQSHENMVITKTNSNYLTFDGFESSGKHAENPPIQGRNPLTR